MFSTKSVSCSQGRPSIRTQGEGDNIIKKIRTNKIVLLANKVYGNIRRRILQQRVQCILSPDSIAIVPHQYTHHTSTT